MNTQLSKATINGIDYHFKITMGVFLRVGNKFNLKFDELQQRLTQEFNDLQLYIEYVKECNKAAHNIDNTVNLLPENVEDLIGFDDMENIGKALYNSLPSQGGGENKDKGE